MALFGSNVNVIRYKANLYKYTNYNQMGWWQIGDDIINNVSQLIRSINIQAINNINQQCHESCQCQ